MSASNRARLFAGAATAVIAACANVTAADAACTTSGTIVSCADATGVSGVNGAVNGVAPPAVTLSVLQGASVTADGSNTISPGSTFSGAVAFNNSGTIGTSAVPVGFSYSGSYDPTATASVNAANSFALSNTGTITGPFSVSNVGGTITLANSGTLSGGLFAQSNGNATLTSSGAIFDAAGEPGAYAVILEAGSETTSADGNTTSTQAADANATITGRVAIPATTGIGATAAVPQAIFVEGTGNATASIDGTAGFTFVTTSGENQTITPSTSTTAGTTTTTTSASDTTSVGGNALLSIGADGQVAGATAAATTGTATVNVLGHVGNDSDPNAIQTGSVLATTGGTHDVFNATQATTTDPSGDTTTFTQSGSTTQLGGNATVDVAQGAAVIGNVAASSNAGDATATIEGQVGSGAGRSIAAAGNVSATALSEDSTFNDTGATSPTASSNSNTTTQSVHGGNASVTIASGADVYGAASAAGDLSATVDNAGRLHGIGGALTATSDRNLQTASANSSSSSTTTASDGTTTTVSSPAGSNFSSTTTSVGGAASGINRSTGTIDGAVQVAGLTSASFQNSGAVFGNVSLSSTGTTQSVAQSLTNTNVVAGTATGTSSSSTTSSSASSVTAIGGAVTGTYGGTIGAIQNQDNAGALPAQTQITQIADGNSSATLSGTAFANFSGTAGGASSTNTSNATTTSTSIPASASSAGSSTLNSTSSTRSSTSFGIATSSATVSGKLLDNGNSTGNLALSANAGDANLVVNGGTLGQSAFSATDFTGSTSVTAAAQQNISSGTDSTFVASGTAVTQPAQSSNFTQFYERDANAGAATVALTNAKTGSLFVSGVGTTGSTGASATVDAASVVHGALAVGVASSVFNSGPGTYATLNDRYDSSNVATRGADGTVTRTITTTETGSNAGGDATASVAGKVASLSVTAPVGNASATLTGSATDGVNIAALGNNFSQSATTTLTGTNATSLTTPLTTATSSSSTATVTGGNASLTIATAPNLASRNAYAVTDGGISVQALGDSSLSIAAGSRVFQNNLPVGGGVDEDVAVADAPESTILVGNSGLQNTSMTSNATFDRNGLLTSNSNVTNTAVGGTATFTNAGTIGTSLGAAFVDVEGLGGATATNTGKIYGSVFGGSLGVNETIATTGTNLSDAVNASTTTVDTVTSTGGTASIANSGLITGSVAVAALTGQIDNNGVVEGGSALGGNVSDGTYTTVDGATAHSVSQTVPDALFTQTYTLNQNGLLLGGVHVGGAYVADGSSLPADPDHLVIKNTQINATINLNNGSVTLGNITGETLASATGSTAPADTLVRSTNTTVNLNGAGFLGVGPNLTPALVTSSPNLENVITSLLGGPATVAYTYSPNYKPYLAIDSSLGTVSATGLFTPSFAGPLGLATGGSRITGIETVEKTGAGTFTVLGSTYLAPAGDSPNATYTMDVGTLKVSGGELQLGVSGVDPTTGLGIFGIRGNVENDATLMLGRSISFGTTSVIEGINARVEGNVNQSATGTLEVGATPALVRQFGTLVLPAQSQGLLGYGQYGVTLSPFVPFGQQYIGLTSTPSTLTVTGDLTLAGKISVAATSGAIYLGGTGRDLFTVDGTFTNSATVSSTMNSPFVNFELTPRTVDGVTVVSLDVSRTPYASVTTTKNAAAAANALDAAMPKVVTAISSLTSPQAVTDVQAYGRQQDLATVMAALDSQLTPAQATEALNELGTGSFYGSLSAISTTRSFGDLADGVATSGRGFGLWFRPTGSFSHFDGSNSTGASSLHVNNYGGSLGFNLLTGADGYFGIAGGYDHIQAHDNSSPETAKADTYMIGAYGAQSFDNLKISAQAVFGWSNWKADRDLTFFDRTATAKFKSKEFRADLRASYDFDLGGFVATPFAQLELRHYKFNGFDEQNAGGIGLSVDSRSKTVFNPEVGGRISAVLGTVKPYAQASYVFQGHIGSNRSVSYLGDPADSFELRGVNPHGYAKLGAGLETDLGKALFFVSGNYLTGGQQKAGEVKGGVMVKF